jgi:thiosulfate/3-mercaptopyruvate sulfurtransferase
MADQKVLISSAELAERVDGGKPPILLDVRWALGDRHGRENYREGHIPGAVFVDLDVELADPPSLELGRHPLPDIERLQEEARGWGISEDSTVVVYDAIGSMAAARAWWLLEWAGVPDVRLLDGGLPAWIAGGHPVAAGPGAEHRPGTIALTAGHMPTISIDEAAEFPSHGVLLDARTAARYLGNEEPVDSRAGHIPGAISAPTAGNLREDGTFRPVDQLAARFAELGVTGDVAVYCGSGVSAAHEIAALAIVGIEASLFPGSWSQWSGDARRDVATG